MTRIRMGISLLLSILLLGSPAALADEGTTTALDVMRAVNTALPQQTDDNYRSFYEVFVYSFYDSDGDGIGDLPGLTEKLDYINDGDPATDGDLGCTGIWLMPVCPSPTYHKYDVTDYRAIDPSYGTLEDMRALLDACHERDIRVIIDLVMNHTSSQHPWFTQAVSYLRTLAPGQEPDADECPYVEYYNFDRDPNSGYYPVAGTDWYYEAPFWSEMPDLNWDSAAVRAEFEAIADFWLDMGVDGFRLDAAKEYYSGDPEANIEVLRWFNDAVKKAHPDAYIVAEVWAGMDEYTPYYASGIDSCFAFAFADSGGVIANSIKRSYTADASSYGRAVEKQEQAVAGYDAIDAPFYTNHDMGRSTGYYPGDLCANQVKIAQAMNLLMGGSAFLYYGEELGMKGSGKDENKRAPMYWSDDPDAAGLCAGPPDMDDVAMKFPSWDQQKDDGDSIFHFVVQTLRLRQAYPVLSHGVSVLEEALSDENVCVLRRTWDEQQALLVFNISDQPQSVDLSALGSVSLDGALVTTAESPALEESVLALPMYSVALLTPSGG